MWLSNLIPVRKDSACNEHNVNKLNVCYWKDGSPIQNAVENGQVHYLFTGTLNEVKLAPVAQFSPRAGQGYRAIPLC